MKTLILVLLLAPAFSHAKSTEGGRFQLIQLSQMRADQFLLDTQTGKIWQRVCLKSEGEQCQLEVWKIQVVEYVNADKAALKSLYDAARKED